MIILRNHSGNGCAPIGRIPLRTQELILSGYVQSLAESDGSAFFYGAEMKGAYNDEQ